MDIAGKDVEHKKDGLDCGHIGPDPAECILLVSLEQDTKLFYTAIFNRNLIIVMVKNYKLKICVEKNK